jgi:HEAT repeat protein
VAGAWALARIDPACAATAPKSVPVLVKALGDSEAMARRHAAESLGRLGPLAKPAVPALKAALKDPDDDVQAAAAAALERIEP